MVVDRLIDLQARLRGEPDPPAPSSVWAATEAWAAGPVPRRRRVARVDPAPVVHDDVEVTVVPSQKERVWVEPTPAQHQHAASSERLASILGRVDELRGELTRVVEALDAATEELSPDRSEPGRNDGPRDRLRQHI